MPDVVIENPVLNSPFAEPSRHFRFDDQGITSAFAIGRGPRSGVGVGVVPLDHHRLRVRAPQLTPLYQLPWTQPQEGLIES